MVDLPEPEEVFGVPHLGRKEVVKFVLGPSLIALGISIGSGEWLLGPLNVGTLGFVGVGWIITVSALLQVFYNLEFSRYVLATGEVPIVGFGRIPPGAWLWIPFSLIALFFAFIWGGWAKAAAQGLYALLYGEVPTAADTTTVTLLAILLLLVVMGITMVSRKITRGLELANLASIAIQLALPAGHRPVHRPLQRLVGRAARLGHPGPAARGQRRHPARRPGRVHRPGVRAELVRDGPLPGQGLRHGLPGRLPRRAARRAARSSGESG